MKELIDFLISQIRHIIPIYFVYEYQMGIRFWCGRFQKVLTPGLWWKVPWLHTMMCENSVDTTIMIPSLNIVTVEGKELILQASVGYRIVDIYKYFILACDVKSVVDDRVKVIIKSVTSLLTYDQIRDVSLNDTLLQLTIDEVGKYGFDIQYVAITSISTGRTFKLYNEGLLT